MATYTHQPIQSHAGRKLSEISLAYLRQARDVIADMNVDDKASFADVIRYMLSFGYTQSQLADEFHVSEATISRWANDKSLPAKLARRSIISRMVEMIDQQIRERDAELQDAMATAAYG